MKNRFFRSYASALLLPVCLGCSAWAGESVTLQQGSPFGNDVYTGTADILLVAGTNAGRNYGGTQSLWCGAGKRGDSSVRRSLIRFDLSGLPDRPIAGGTLVLHCIEISGEPEWAIYAVKKANAAWIEGRNVNGTAEMNVSSWSHRVNFYQEWNGGGGLGQPGEGYEEAPLFSSSEAPQRARAGEPMQIPLSVALLESWRTGENAGLLLRVMNEGGDEYIRFISADGAKEKFRPQLEIRFEEK